jgi:hypothetical protein
MPTLPKLTLPRTELPRRRPTPPLAPSPSRSARATLKREIREVQKKIEFAARTFYEVGVQLNAWKKTQSWRALSPASGEDFKTFVTAHVRRLG